jgi:phytanoyl-CoA hydroxylase
VLSLDEIDRYHRDGYLAIEDFATPAACAALKARADEIVEAFEPSELRTVFTTDEQQRHSNREFFDSASGVWCFFEGDAFDPDGELRQDKRLSINSSAIRRRWRRSLGISASPMPSHSRACTSSSSH